MTASGVTRLKSLLAQCLFQLVQTIIFWMNVVKELQQALDGRVSQSPAGKDAGNGGALGDIDHVVENPVG